MRGSGTSGAPLPWYGSVAFVRYPDTPPSDVKDGTRHMLANIIPLNVGCKTEDFAGVGAHVWEVLFRACLVCGVGPPPCACGLVNPRRLSMPLFDVRRCSRTALLFCRCCRWTPWRLPRYSSASLEPSLTNASRCRLEMPTDT